MEFPSMVNVPAGGYIDLGGGIHPAEATIDVFNPDGSPFNYEYKVDQQVGCT
jgi:hypothetical protein